MDPAKGHNRSHERVAKQKCSASQKATSYKLNIRYSDSMSSAAGCCITGHVDRECRDVCPR